RRHTRSKRDWSSDVCSSDLELVQHAFLEAILESVLYEFPVRELDFAMPRWVTMLDSGHWLQSSVYQAALDFAARITRMKDLQARSEERRVGKEARTRGTPHR